MIAGALLFGFGIGNATSLPPLIAQQEFVKVEVQRVVSLIVASAQIAYAFTPAAFAAVRALSSGWFAETPIAFLLMTAIFQAFAGACMLCRQRRDRRRLVVAGR